ncbi:MAG: D-glycero-beta-D-manno-heptose 1-phosphate adenylyltransferase [Bacteroidota bacterium]
MRTHSPELTQRAAAAHALRQPAGRVLVVGDLMLDRYVWGLVERVSPEAPVPVVRLDRNADAAGGASNVALSLRRLGLEVLLIGTVGHDLTGDRLVRLLDEANIETDYLVRTTARRTTSKTRVLGGVQQMLRIDSEQTGPLAETVEAQVVAQIEAAFAAKPDAVLLSDYAKGVLSSRVCALAIGCAHEAGIPVYVDPKGSDYTRYRGATAVTPNERELTAATNHPAKPLGRLLSAADHLRRQLGIEQVIATRGADGIVRISDTGADHFPARLRAVYDVSGAGDAVIATLVAARVAGLDADDAVRLANLAGGVAVGQVGTTPIDAAQLLDELGEPVQSWTLGSASQQAESWRRRGERIAFTNGCFDVLHAGHVQCLRDAASQADRLIVGVNSDASVRRLKGSERPVNQEADRASVLAALRFVDAVVVFGEDTPLRLIETLRPDVLVKGGDYQPHEIVGHGEVESWGGRTVIVPYLAGRSTTRTLATWRARSAAV